MLKKFSLQRQLIIIFSLIALVVLAILVPLINKNLNNLIDIKKQDLLQKRYNKFRKMGNFYEV